MDWKCYIFAEKVFTSDNKDHGLYAIVGSSNFTERGLEEESLPRYFLLFGVASGCCTPKASALLRP